MTKRFTSTEKWSDPWYRKLSLEAKCFWDFICCSVDNAGVWKIDWELASFKIGKEINVKILEELNEGKNRVKVFNNEYLIISDFIPYQIGNIFSLELTNLQKSSISLLNKYITEKNIPKDYFMITGSLPVANGYRYKGKGKGKVKEDRIVKERNNFDFELVWKEYPDKVGRKEAEKHFKSTVLTEDDFNNIKIALQNYKNCKRVKSGYIQNGSTWFNNWRDWVSYQEPQTEKDRQNDIDKLIFRNK